MKCFMACFIHIFILDKSFTIEFAFLNGFVKVKNLFVAMIKLQKSYKESRSLPFTATTLLYYVLPNNITQDFLTTVRVISRFLMLLSSKKYNLIQLR